MEVVKKSTAASKQQAAVKRTKATASKSAIEGTASTKVRKIYVIDTSVLLHDHNCINSFEDNSFLSNKFKS
jgi:hypothetical protein